MNIKRRKSKVISIGSLRIGGEYPVAIQSMAKTKASCIEETLQEIQALTQAGCEIVRVAVKDNLDAKAIKKIREQLKVPLVADIHFDWRLAIAAIEAGVDKIRLNPGNIHKKDEVREIVSAAKRHHIPIRVGVNSGSLRRTTRCSIPNDMVKSAQEYIKILEGCKFYDIVVSLKASNIFDTIDAYRAMARVSDYAFHIGVTATGPAHSGIVKSSIALGILLSEGIGDTIRVSLTAAAGEEVKAAQDILESVGLRHFRPEIISCPTCGRCEVDLVKFVNKIDTMLSSYPVSRLASLTGKPASRQTGKPLKVAVMGCVVNGPGEASGADIGVAFGKSKGLVFKRGRAVRSVPFCDCLDTLLEEIKKNE